MRRLLRSLSAVVCVLSIVAVLYPPVSESISRYWMNKSLPLLLWSMDP